MADNSLVLPQPGMDNIFDVDVEEIDDLNEIDNIMIRGQDTPTRLDDKVMENDGPHYLKNQLKQ